jgi:hypothetical protein
MLGIAVRAPRVRDVSNAAVNLMKSGRESAPEVCLPSAFEERP